MGYETSGWTGLRASVADTSRKPQTEADVVNLGFIVNVIERARERADALGAAWRLVQRMLVVAARLEWETCSFSGQAQAGEFVIAKGMFQKLYPHDEYAHGIDRTLGARSAAAAPGVYFSDQPSAFASR
jgi:DNA phosphorothioation-associated putative methyltransferase